VTLSGSYSGDVNFNAGAATVSYTVNFQFFGFDSPLGPEGSQVGPFNPGRTLPVKWAVKDGAGNPLPGISDARKTLNVQGPFACGQPAAGVVRPLDPSATGGTSLRYDATSGQFTFNWDTSGYAVGCYQMQLTLKDDSLHILGVRLQ